MRCIITTKGSDEFITYVDKEKAEVQIYQNKNSIAHLTLECSSAAYDGNRLLYTTDKNGTIFITDLDNSHTIEVRTHYDAIFIEQILREFDDLVLLSTSGKHIIYDYVNNKDVFDCTSLTLDRIYDLSMNKYGIGRAAGFHREYNDDEDWRFHAVTFRGNLASNSLDVEDAVKFSLYEDFYERTHCYDSSVGEAAFPIFYVYNDAYCAKAVSENYIVYVPGYEHHVVIVADIFGKIHRLLAYPETISNQSRFAYNETTDVVTIATDEGKIYRYYVNTVDIDLFEKMFKTYDQRTYFSSNIESEIRNFLEKALEQAEGMPETAGDCDAKKITMRKAVEYCRNTNNSQSSVIMECVFYDMLNNVKITCLSEDTVTLTIDSEFILDSIKKMYLELLKEAFKKTLGHEVDVEIKTEKQE